MTSRMMPETTARVAASPTAEAPAKVCRPRRQPIPAPWAAAPERESPRQGLQPAQAANPGDQDREDERLDEAGHEIREVDDPLDFVDERDEGNRERLQGHGAAEQADQVP